MATDTAAIDEVFSLRSALARQELLEELGRATGTEPARLPAPEAEPRAVEGDLVRHAPAGAEPGDWELVADLERLVREADRDLVFEARTADAVLRVRLRGAVEAAHIELRVDGRPRLDATAPSR